MSIYVDIRNTLEHFIRLVKGAPEAIYYENVDYKPVEGVPHLQLCLIPTSRKPHHVGLNPVQKYIGVLKVFACYPAYEGPFEAEDAVDKILSAFDATRDFIQRDTPITIMSAERGQGYVEDIWYKIPINIEWYTYK